MLEGRIKRLEDKADLGGQIRVVLYCPKMSEEERGQFYAEKKAEILAAGEDLHPGNGGPSIIILDLNALAGPMEPDPDEEGS